MEPNFHHRKNNYKMDKHRTGREQHKFKSRRLKPGVEYVDRELGVGIVRNVSDEGVTVAFGDMEKVFPRKHHERPSHEHSSVFTFSSRPTRRRRVRVDDPVYSKELGKGTVTRINERGTYVTFEKTGESILFPTGIPNDMLYREKPDKKPEERKMPKGKGRTYVVEEAPVVKKEKKAPSHPAKIVNHGHVNYIEISKGTEVVSPDNGAGVIDRIDEGKLFVSFKDGQEIGYTYPQCFENGSIEVVEADKKTK
jgi:hypothetical protein